MTETEVALEQLLAVYRAARAMARRYEQVHPLSLSGEERELMDAIHAAEATGGVPG